MDRPASVFERSTVVDPSFRATPSDYERNQGIAFFATLAKATHKKPTKQDRFCVSANSFSQDGNAICPKRPSVRNRFRFPQRTSQPRPSPCNNSSIGPLQPCKLNRASAYMYPNLLHEPPRLKREKPTINYGKIKRR